MDNEKQLIESMTLLERTAWDLFITFIDNFLGKRKSVDCKNHIANMLKLFRKLAGLQYEH